ncbi:SDR family NAD(P)-dependent oxidoreductase [Minwuia thermotolerans]|uniref:Short-chain dehydrogenase n=1 Tax=Minwuia thermotolerans TaxID=2056226 RepID=A0A2M9G3V4_9PROT|nr:SDR family NAD(P)-dependent oxidoreductase [Minwuia thermotolerans]PJK30391.1 short-chain dehydrogenase [Minwuia thermotolerans]
MREIEDRIAFVTGGASGIGLAVAKALVNRGARVMLADIDADALALAKAEIGQAAEGVVCDVASAQSVEEAAQATIDAFGKVHMVFNNAGVGLGGKPGEVSLKDWRWIVDINLMGVVHGVETFLPLIRGHGEGGHIVNTASMAGHWANPMMGPYCATKFAVVGYSECLRQALAPEGIGVSVLCPGWVKTAITDSGKRRPSGPPAGASVLSGAEAVGGNDSSTVTDLIAHGMPPEVLADWVTQCVQDNRLYIFSHAVMEPVIGMRHQAIKADYAAAIANESLTKNQTS